MSIKTNSQEGSVKLNLQNSSTSGFQLGYTGSSQLNLNLPVSYGSSGQVLTTDGSGQLTWSNAGTGGGGGGTNGTSGTSGTSGQSGSSGTSAIGTSGTSGQTGSSGTSGSSGISSTLNSTFWYGTSTQSQTLATGSSLISLVVSAENNVSGATAVVFDESGQYLITWSATLGEKPSGGYDPVTPTYLWSTYLKYNNQTVGESTTAVLPFVLDQDPTGIDALFTLSGQSSIYATAGSTLELWSQYQKERIYLRPINAFTGSTSAKMFVTKLT
jgi:hypothetical protein